MQPVRLSGECAEHGLVCMAHTAASGALHTPSQQQPLQAAAAGPKWTESPQGILRSFFMF